MGREQSRGMSGQCQKITYTPCVYVCVWVGVPAIVADEFCQFPGCQGTACFAGISPDAPIFMPRLAAWKCAMSFAPPSENTHKDTLPDTLAHPLSRKTFCFSVCPCHPATHPTILASCLLFLLFSPAAPLQRLPLPHQR